MPKRILSGVVTSNQNEQTVTGYRVLSDNTRFNETLGPRTLSKGP